MIERVKQAAQLVALRIFQVVCVVILLSILAFLVAIAKGPG